MNRRDFLRTTAVSAVANAAASEAAAQPRRRPNILYVFSDQHRAQSVPGEPYSPVKAPALNAFRRNNFSMERTVSNYPLCTPYRGMFLTGRWPYQTGLIENGAAIKPDEISLGRVFRDAGYHTAYVGKWHLHKGNGFIPAGPDRQGFEDWHVWERTNDHYSAITYDPATGARQQPEGWNCTLMTDQAIEIIRRQKADKPWMMVVSWNPPHFPFDPPEEDAQPYPVADLPMRPNVRLSLPGQRATGIANALTSDAALRKSMRGYYGAVTGVDGEFARLLRILEETGQAEDTIVIYTSDHGEMMGSQGRMAKSVPFEESVRVPFYVRVPGAKPGGRTSETLFGAIDIYPTVCGLAGLPVPKHCAGRDFSGVIRGDAPAPPAAPVFLMNQLGGADDEGGGGARRQGAAAPAPHMEVVTRPSYRGIRTDTHTYAVAETGPWCLFDNAADPYQMTNLIDDPKHKALRDRLDQEIIAWLKAAGDPFPYAELARKIATPRL